jgi:hypothetical protein
MQKEHDMNHLSTQRPEDLSAHQIAAWRVRADAENPAGPLYIGGQYAEADILGDIVLESGRCGTVCTGSRTRQCC